jgi:hypothetical protein
MNNNEKHESTMKNNKNKENNNEKWWKRKIKGWIMKKHEKQIRYNEQLWDKQWKTNEK